MRNKRLVTSATKVQRPKKKTICKPQLGSKDHNTLFLTNHPFVQRERNFGGALENSPFMGRIMAVRVLRAC